MDDPHVAQAPTERRMGRLTGQMQRRSSAVVTLVVVACLALVTAVASASTLVYFEGWTASVIGPRHTLTRTSVRALSENVACTAAETLNFEQVGTAICTWGYAGEVAEHAYCQCELRYPWAGTPIGYPEADLRAREDY